MKIDRKDIKWGLLTLALLTLIFIQRCGQIDEIAKIHKEYSIIKKADGSTVGTQLQNNFTKDEAIESGLLRVENYMKKIEAQIRVSNATIIREKLVPYSVPVERIVYVDSSKQGVYDTSIYIKVPLPISYKDSFNFLSGNVTVDGFKIDSFGSINELQITIFDKKAGFLKKRIPVVEVTSKNPNITITGMENVIIKTKKPFYKKAWVIFTCGVASATYVIKGLLKL